MPNDLSKRVYAKVYRMFAGTGLWRSIAVTLPLRVLGRRYRVPVSRGVGMGNVLHGDWWLEELLTALLPDARGTFIDVGANVGQTLLKVKACDPGRSWIGFEPNPACVAYLHELIRVNGLEGCTVVPAALGDHTGLLPLDCFHEDPADATASVVSGFRPTDPVLRRLWVPMVDFGALHRAGMHTEIGFVKIDVEGGEKEVLESLGPVLERDRPFVVLEILPVHSPQNRERLERQRAVERQMAGLGYVLCRVEKTPQGRCLGLRLIDEIGIHDQLMWSDYVVVPREKVEATLKRTGRAEKPGAGDAVAG